MFGFQAAGAAPLVHGAPVRHPETIATAIRIGAPASWDAAVTARDESGGRFAAVTDDEILAAYRLLSAREAVFVEPASAASVAGLLQSAADGTLPRGSLVVCTVTGHGLKDPDTALLSAPEPDGGPARPGGGGHGAGAGLMGRPTEVPGARARLLGEPRAGLRLARPRARPLRRRRGVRRPRRRHRRGGRRRRGPGAVRRRAPRRPRDAHHVGHHRRRAAGPADALPQRHPALPGAGQLGRRRGRWRGGRGRARRPRRRAGARHDPAGHGGYGGPRRQRGGQPARRVRRRVGDGREYRGAVPRCTARRAPGHRVRSRSSREPSRSPAPRAGCCPMRVPLADAAFTGSRTALLGAGLHAAPRAADARHRGPPAPGLPAPGLPASRPISSTRCARRAWPRP